MAVLDDYLAAILLGILLLSAIGSLALPRLPGHWWNDFPEVKEIFGVPKGWLALRVAAAVLGIVIVFQLGPEIAWGDATGQVVFYELAITIVTLFALAAFFIPLLTDFGLMEIVGAVLSPLFRRLFTLPGRAAIDASASWFSAAAVGVLITSKQFVAGHYSAREACVIATNFSVVSLPFCLLVTSVLGIDDLFIEFYTVVIVVGLVSAIILPRLPPLSRIDDAWLQSSMTKQEVSVDVRQRWRAGVQHGLARADEVPSLRRYFRQCFFNVLEVWLGLLPGVIVVGLFGLILAEHTPIGEIVSWPLVPVLELLRLPQAAAAAPTMVLGFIDMFLPAAIGKDIHSELTRFVIAGVSISQLIYMSEVGILILRSPIPLSFWALVQLFLLRTVIALPLCAMAGHILGLV